MHFNMQYVNYCAAWPATKSQFTILQLSHYNNQLLLDEQAGIS